VSDVPRPLRRALIEAMGGWGPYTVREIEHVFEDHGFEGTADVEPEQGVRRTTAAQYLATVDWDDDDQRTRLQAVIDEVLANYPTESAEPGELGERLRRALARALDAQAPETVAERPADDPPFERTTDEDDPFDIWPPGRVRLFLSHTSRHPEFVGAVATVLETWPIACFVAHDEIEPSLAWQEVIESALRSCHALIAFVTEDFLASEWCDQETGWALGRDLAVIPLRLEANPHGFVAAIQAVPSSLERRQRSSGSVWLQRLLPQPSERHARAQHFSWIPFPMPLWSSSVEVRALS